MAAFVTSTQTIPCAFVKGAALPQSERVQTFGITGVNGVGVHLLGLFGQTSQFEAKQWGSNAGLNIWFNSLHALIGQIVVVETDEGQVYPNQLIENVTQPRKRNADNRKGSEQLWTVTVTTRTV